MRKKLVFILVFVVFTLMVTTAVFYKKQAASDTLLCEISDFLNREEKLLQQSYRSENSDPFFWIFYGRAPFENLEKEIKNLKANLKLIDCFAVDEEVGWFGFLVEEQQRSLLQTIRTRQVARKNLANHIELAKIQKQLIFKHIQADLKKYRFHVHQLKQSLLPSQIVASACRAPASAIDPKKQNSCRRALILTKEFRAKDESNLGSNRRILLEKWQMFREWIEQAISEIEQDDGKENAEVEK